LNDENRVNSNVFAVRCFNFQSCSHWFILYPT